VNSPLPFQSVGAHFLQIDGPDDKNALVSGMVGGTPSRLQGTDPLGYSQDVIQSWLSGVSLSDLPSGASPVDEGQSGTDTSFSHTATRVGVGVLAIVLIGIGIFWVLKT